MRNILTIITLAFFISCAKEKETIDQNKRTKENENISKGKEEKMNISFLLDLSDRIDPKKYPNESMDFYKRDISYINSIASIFDNHIRSKKVRRVDDKIQLFFDPEPKNSKINEISNHLKYHLTKENLNKNLLNEFKNAYLVFPEEIYELAIKDGKYVGSDTWRFFKNKAQNYCIEDGHRNILVVLTDGYIYHKSTIIKEGSQTTYLTPKVVRSNKLTNSKWENLISDQEFGFIPINIDLSNLEILVLGINPDSNNPYEEDVIKRYWSDWFKKMNVKRFEIRSTDLPSNMEKVIKDFIFKS